MDNSGDRDWVINNLRYEVFHITPKRCFENILKSGEIRPSTVLKDETAFSASENSYLRDRGCVSLFDLRFATAKQIRNGLSFINPFRYEFDGSPVLLILKPDAYAKVVRCGDCREESLKIGQRLLPHIEAGYPGAISTDLIDRCLLITVINMPPDPNY